jgi:hypothetical protein
MSKEGWQTLLMALADTQEDELTCAELNDEALTLYAEMALAGVDPGARFLPIQQHLRHCTDCREQVAELVNLLRLAQADVLVQPLSPPQFDLPFLSMVQPAPSLPAQVQELFAHGRLWVRDQSAALWVNLAAALNDTLTFQPALVTKGQSPVEQAVIYHLSIGSEVLGDLDLEVMAWQDVEPHLCTLQVQVQTPSRWPELDGVRVLLLTDADRRSSVTNTNGQVRFAGFPVRELGRAKLQVAASDAPVGSSQ